MAQKQWSGRFQDGRSLLVQEAAPKNGGGFRLILFSIVAGVVIGLATTLLMKILQGGLRL